jgi:hypothetical protein
MGDNQNRTALDDVAHVFLDDALGFVIEGRGGFVENQDAGIANQSTGDGDALTLATCVYRKPYPGLSNDRIG